MNLRLLPLLLGAWCWMAFFPAGHAENSLPPGIAVIASSDQEKTFNLIAKKSVPNYWDLQTRKPNISEIHKGDVLLLSFSMKTVSTRKESGEGIIQAVFEENTSPWDKSLSREIHSGSEWKKWNIPFIATRDFKIGEGSLSFCFGFGEQEVQLTDVSLVNYAQRTTLDKLPRTPVTYVGREPDAPWRKEAEERIEKIRKGPLTVTVLDGATHQPVANAEVSVKMLKHAFGFGTAVARMDSASPADQQKYQEMLTNYFNLGVIENALKWGPWERDKAGNLAFVNHLAELGLRLKGHNVIWPGWRAWASNSKQGWDVVPKSIYELRDNPAELRKQVDARVSDVATAMSGKLEEWDVINEPFWNHDIMDVLGEQEMVHWFQLVHQADPHAKLMVNEAVTAEWRPMSDNLVRVVNFIDQNGAHVDGIGLQCHYEENLTPLPEVDKTLSRYAVELPGKFIQITEFDISTNDEQLQADYLRDFMTMMFSYPEVTDFLMWGFWEGQDWKSSAALWRKDWSLKPNGRAYIDLVTKTWWTDVSGKSDASGKFETRGFYGSYEITAKSGNRSQSVKAELKPGGSDVTIVLP